MLQHKNQAGFHSLAVKRGKGFVCVMHPFLPVLRQILLNGSYDRVPKACQLSIIISYFLQMGAIQRSGRTSVLLISEFCRTKLRSLLKYESEQYIMGRNKRGLG